MSWLGRLFGRAPAASLQLVMTYKNDTGGIQRVVLEPLGRAFLVEPNRRIEIFDHSPPDDPFVRIDNRGDVVTIYRWMTPKLEVRVGGRTLEPLDRTS